LKKVAEVQFSFGSSVIKVNVADKTALLAAVRARLQAGTGFALATINLDHLVKLHRSDSFRRAYRAHDLIVADGNPIVWLSRLAGAVWIWCRGRIWLPPWHKLPPSVGAPSRWWAALKARLTARPQGSCAIFPACRWR
jgi:hypothetical protein